jgi:Cdc6-like AAA superfamily ATPase
VEGRDFQNLQLDAQKQLQHEVIIQWLSSTDYPAQQHDIITQRQQNTGKWFLESPEFRKWLQGSDKTLFCPGIPGAGKTMIAAIAIDQVQKSLQSNEIAVSFVYCNYKAQDDQSTSQLLSALLKQLLYVQPKVETTLMQTYEKCSREKVRPSTDDIMQVFLSVCSSYHRVYLIVDALDECSDSEGSRTLLIEKLRELQSKMDIRLLFTSRFIPEITQHFQSNVQLEIRASEEDVRRFVAGQIPRLPNCIKRDEGLKIDVQDRIVKAVDGM